MNKTDNLRAFDVLCLAIKENPCMASDIEENDRRRRRAARRRKFSLDKMRDATDEQKAKIGNVVLCAYRRKEKCDAIDFDKLKQWCLDHWKLILLVKIGLMLALFCL